jgi:hypothetical protein
MSLRNYRLVGQAAILPKPSAAGNQISDIPVTIFQAWLSLAWLSSKDSLQPAFKIRKGANQA